MGRKLTLCVVALCTLGSGCSLVDRATRNILSELRDSTEELTDRIHERHAARGPEGPVAHASLNDCGNGAKLGAPYNPESVASVPVPPVAAPPDRAASAQVTQTARSGPAPESAAAPGIPPRMPERLPPAPPPAPVLPAALRTMPVLRNGEWQLAPVPASPDAESPGRPSPLPPGPGLSAGIRTVPVCRDGEWQFGAPQGQPEE